MAFWGCRTPLATGQIFPSVTGKEGNGNLGAHGVTWLSEGEQAAARLWQTDFPLRTQGRKLKFKKILRVPTETYMPMLPFPPGDFPEMEDDLPLE